MKIGDLVKYSDNSDQLGIVLVQRDNTFLIQWNNGKRLWRHIEVLEVVNENR